MSSKIRIRMGQLEVECEGTEEFLKKELPALLTAISSLYQQTGSRDVDDESPEEPVRKSRQRGAVVGTTGSLAATLKVKSGSDLAVAAAAQLTIVQGKASFTRKELIVEMRTATGYFKDNYVSNLTKILGTLVTGQKFNEVSANTYALKAAEKERLEKELA